MKKIFVSFFLVSTVILFSTLTSAQTDLTPVITGGPAASQLKIQLTPTQKGRTVELNGSGLVPNFDVYIVDCLPTDEGLKCTTGNPDYDNPAILGIGGIESQVKFIDGDDALRSSDNLGNVQATVEFIVNQSIGNVFYGIQIKPPVLTNEGRNDSLQYGTFQFDPAIKPVDFRADPKGRIFDSQSLEPISNVKVRILDQLTPERLADAQPSSTVTVGPDGQFNFMVEEGTYYLRLDPATHPNHTFSANPILNTNYTKAYAGPTENCYQETGKTHQTCSVLYQPDQPINEVPPDETERDIPLDPGTNPPFRSEPTFLIWGNYVNGMKTVYEGKISHPLSLVSLAKENGEPLIVGNDEVKTTVDKYGSWQIILANENIPQDQGLKPVITKVDLTQNQPTSKRLNIFSRLAEFLTFFLRKNVSAQAKTPVFQPIPRYLEGYAYDGSGKIIPNATVKIKLNMSPSKEAIYYQTTADESGFFKVDPNNLPIFGYYLQFEKPGSTLPVKMTTSQFAQKNSSYLETNQINLLTAKKGDQSLITMKETVPTSAQPLPQEITTSPTSTVSQSSATLIIVLLLVGLVLLAVAVYLYLQKKNNPSPPMA